MPGQLRRALRSGWEHAVAMLAGACLLALAGGTVAAASVSHGQNTGAASAACATTDRAPGADGRPVKGAKIRRSADAVLVPKGAVTLTVCSYNGMNATRATPQFGLLGIGDTARPRTLAQLTTELDAIRAVRHGATYHCPFDDGSEAILYFGYRSGPGDVVTVGMSGCNAVTNMAQQTISVPDAAAIPRDLALGAPVISQIAKLAQPLGKLRWPGVVGHIRLCGGPAPGRCWFQKETYPYASRVTAINSSGLWVAMAQLQHNRFRFKIAATGVYRFELMGTGKHLNTVISRRTAIVRAGSTTSVVFTIPVP